MKKILLLAGALLVVLLTVIVAFLSQTPDEGSLLQPSAQHGKPVNPAMAAQASAGMKGDVGELSIGSMNATTFLTTWNFNNLPETERRNYYRESYAPNGTLIREYWFYSEDKDIEVAPGVIFPAWVYNGQVPGPTIRATEGDMVKIHFTNRGTKPHSMHFHGYHDARNDGSAPDEMLLPGQSFTYAFSASPFGTHLYHCHSVPLTQHIHKGLYGTFIVDPANDSRRRPDKEFVMVMNGFDTNYDGGNEFYAVNTNPFYYTEHPIQVKQGELVRIYLSNLVEFDLLNSFHLHANFFDEYPTGTDQNPAAFTDVTSMVQGERSVLDVRFAYPGMYMFHGHVSEFAEKGWMGFFEVAP